MPISSSLLIIHDDVTQLRYLYYADPMPRSLDKQRKNDRSRLQSDTVPPTIDEFNSGNS